MKQYGRLFGKCLAFFFLWTIVCGGIYPLLVTGLAQVIFPQQAGGSLIEIEGQTYGSALVAQQFRGEGYLWGREMKADTTTFTNDAGQGFFYSGAFNYATASPEYGEVIKERVAQMQLAHPAQQGTAVPVDLVTGSGSGLDPHISVAAANYQIERIAQARGLSTAQVKQIVLNYTEQPFLGLIGESTVNVLLVNLALDGLAS